MTNHAETDVSTAAILSRVMAAREHCQAFTADERTSPAERKAAIAANLMLDGLLDTYGQDVMAEKWDAALFTLEALSRAHDSLGNSTRHTFRTIYRALAGR